MSAVADKRAMYQMLRRGSFGHTLPSAGTLAEAEPFLAACASLAVRSKQAGGPCAFGLKPEEARAMIGGLPPGSWDLSPMLEDRRRRCYGHLHDSPFGWKLHYSETRKACRLVQAEDGCEQRWLEGIAAREYLRGIMDQQGFDTLEELVREYPGHVIEFTVMSSRMHAFGPSSVIFWEVRCSDGTYEGGKWGGTRPVDWDSWRTTLTDHDFLRLAYIEAQESKDLSVQNGAVLVRPGEGIVLARGHNDIHPALRDLPARRGRPHKHAWTEHAERNAIYDAARRGIATEGLTLYCPWFACADCARAIVAAGIKRVVGHAAPCHRKHPGWAESITTGDQMLREAGIEAVRLEAFLNVRFRFNGETEEA